MHLDDAPRDGLITVSDDDVLDLELIRRGLIGRHHDIRFLINRHDPTQPVCALSVARAPLTKPSLPQFDQSDSADS